MRVIISVTRSHQVNMHFIRFSIPSLFLFIFARLPFTARSVSISVRTFRRDARHLLCLDVVLPVSSLF